MPPAHLIAGTVRAGFFPILLVARDGELMGEHRDGVVANVLGWAYFALICMVTVAAPILLFATNAGGGG